VLGCVVLYRCLRSNLNLVCMCQFAGRPWTRFLMVCFLYHMCTRTVCFFPIVVDVVWTKKVVVRFGAESRWTAHQQKAKGSIVCVRSHLSVCENCINTQKCSIFWMLCLGIVLEIKFTKTILLSNRYNLWWWCSTPRIRAALYINCLFVSWNKSLFVRARFWCEARRDSKSAAYGRYWMYWY